MVMGAGGLGTECRSPAERWAWCHPAVSPAVWSISSGQNQLWLQVTHLLLAKPSADCCSPYRLSSISLGSSQLGVTFLLALTELHACFCLNFLRALYSPDSFWSWWGWKVCLCGGAEISLFIWDIYSPVEKALNIGECHSCPFAEQPRHLQVSWMEFSTSAMVLRLRKSPVSQIPPGMLRWCYVKIIWGSVVSPGWPCDPCPCHVELSCGGHCCTFPLSSSHSVHREQLWPSGAHSPPDAEIVCKTPVPLRWEMWHKRQIIFFLPHSLPVLFPRACVRVPFNLHTILAWITCLYQLHTSVPSLGPAHTVLQLASSDSSFPN